MKLSPDDHRNRPHCTSRGNRRSLLPRQARRRARTPRSSRSCLRSYCSTVARRSCDLHGRYDLRSTASEIRERRRGGRDLTVHRHWHDGNHDVVVWFGWMVAPAPGRIVDAGFSCTHPRKLDQDVSTYQRGCATAQPVARSKSWSSDLLSFHRLSGVAGGNTAERSRRDNLSPVSHERFRETRWRVSAV